MKEKVVEIKTSRDSYSRRYVIDPSLTVGELIEILNQYDDDTKVIFNNDNGYTFGFLREEDIYEFFDPNE